MDSERYERISEIFHRVCELGPAEREAFLDAACIGDSSLRREVDSLLASDSVDPGLLDSKVMRRQVHAVLKELPLANEPHHHPRHIGPYKILKYIGGGGQGLVYEAEQSRPRRSVALKVLRGGACVEDSEVRRFQREIRSLAALHHPSIATIYEAGQTDEGQHFFAMELIAGAAITTYAREQRLSLRQRLQLFCAVGDAVHYAHQAGVIHRDLKPANILVDDQEKPKVLDFGLARITRTDVTQISTDIHTGQIAGSLRYMSPEQARGKTDAIDIRTDVYSLGIILYELLTGRQPYEVGEFLPDAVQAICNAPPNRPSAVDRALRGNLETIVLKALEKEPSRRYGTVDELVGDIRRHLTGEPIVARPPGRLELLLKRIHSHPVAAGVCTVLLVAGLIGIQVSIKRHQTEIAKMRAQVCSRQRSLEHALAERTVGEIQIIYNKHPKLPDARLVLAQAKYRLSLILDSHILEFEAIRILTEAEDDQSYRWAYLALLVEIYRERQFDIPPAWVKIIESETPNTAEAWYLRSLATLDETTAIECIDKAIELNRRHNLALARRAYLCEQLEDYNCALSAARRLILLGSDAKWNKYTGDLLMRLGRYEEALWVYESYSTMKIEEDHLQQAFTARAAAHLCLREYESAVEDYTSAIESTHQWKALWTHYKRATPLWILDRTEEAIDDYLDFRSGGGQNSYAHARLFLVRQDHAERLEQSGMRQEAEKLREKADKELRIAMDRVDSGSWLAKICECLLGECSPDDLVAAAEPGDLVQLCEAAYYAAEMHLRSDRVDEAMKLFRVCVDTALVFDPYELNPVPMNEYHLARWRLDQLNGGTSAAEDAISRPAFRP